MRQTLAFILILTSISDYSGDQDPHQQAESGEIHLSVDLRELLKQEMLEITKGMESLVLWVSSANWHEIETTGRSIQNSYILKSKLTKDQKQELHNVLPAEFKSLDKKFHHYAGMLSHVAEKKNMELVNFYIYKMNEVCTSCHSKFVANRFQGFERSVKPAEHKH